MWLSTCPLHFCELLMVAMITFSENYQKYMFCVEEGEKNEPISDFSYRLKTLKNCQKVLILSLLFS